jgi:hypothetical protein
MSSFFSQASFVMDPSVYRAGTLFVPKPTDGSGDLNVTRSNDTATRVGSDGLIEKVRTNVLLQSNSFNTTWANNNTSETGGQSGYDGSSNAWLLNSTASFGSITQSFTAINGVCTLSIYAKAGTNNWLLLRLNAATDARTWFDLSNGVLGTTDGPTIESKIQSVGDGWYRCSVSANVSVFSEVLIYPTNANTVVGSAGNILIQAAQLELGDIATDYIGPTLAAAVSVGPVANVPRLDYLNSSCPRLLLEPQRTNLNTYSDILNNAVYVKQNVTISANNTTSPSGYVDADKIVEDTANTNKNCRFPNTSLTSGTTYNVSFFAKPDNCDVIAIREGAVSGDAITYKFSTGTTSLQGTRFASLVVTDYANGFKRISVNFLPTSTASHNFRIQLLGNAYSQITNTNAGTYTYLGDGVSGVWAWGCTVEVGTYPTSVIPTLGSASTRGADACSKTGISSLIGQTEGTLYLEADIVKKNETEFYYAISAGGTLGDSIYIHQVSQEIFVNKRVGGVTQNIIVSSANWNSGNNKIAVKYTASEMKIFINGVLKDTEAISGLPSSLSMLTIGSRQDVLGVLASDAKYKQALLFPTALSDADAIALTA